MVSAGRVATDAKSSDDLSAWAIQRHTAAEEDQPARNLIFSAASAAWRSQGFRVKRIGLTQTPKRVAGLGERIESRRGQGKRIEAKGVGRIGLGFCDGLAAGPHLRRISCRRNESAYFTVAIHDRTPHARAIEQSANRTARGLGGDEKCPQLAIVRQA